MQHHARNKTVVKDLNTHLYCIIILSFEYYHLKADVNNS